MNLADALRRVNSETAAGNPVAAPRPTTSSPSTAAHTAPSPEKAYTESFSIPNETSSHVHSGNVVRLELFLSAEQMGGLFRAIMAGQHTVLTLREAASFLRISQDALVKMAEDGEIPGVLMEGRWRFPKSNLEEWLVVHSNHAEESEDVA